MSNGVSDELYVDNKGQLFRVIKSFSDTEHLIEHVVDAYDPEWDSYYEEWSEQRYYGGVLVKYKEFNIKEHPSIKLLNESIKELESKKKSISEEINTINTERNSLLASAKKYNQVKEFLEVLMCKKRFLVAVAHWGVRVYDCNTNKSTSNAGYDEDGEYKEFDSSYSIYDFSHVKLQISFNPAFYSGSSHDFTVGASFEKSSKAPKDVYSWDGGCRIFYCDTVDEIKEELYSAYKESKISRSNFVNMYKTLKFKLPDDVAEQLKIEQIQKDKRELEQIERDIATKQEMYIKAKEKFNI